MKNIEDYELTPEQIKVFKAAVRALKKCAKANIHLLAKCNALYAYNDKAFDEGLVAPLHEEWDFDYSNPVPCKCEFVIDDSGADETEYFKKGALD